MKKILFISIILFLGATFLFAMGYGERVKELDRFDKLEVHTSGQLSVREGRGYQLEIQGPVENINKIRTEVRDGTLHINLKTWYGRIRNVSYILTVPNLVTVRTSSSCDIDVPEMHGDILEVVTSSSGDITVGKMKSEDLDVETTSSGNISLGQVETLHGWVGTSSSGDIFINHFSAYDPILKLSSSGNLTIAEVVTASLRTEISSSGDCNLESGNLGILDLKISSSGEFLAENPVCGEADVVISSSGKAAIRTDGLLNARLSSSGDLFVEGAPRLGRIVTSSSGSVHTR
ncbi:MAG: DUF2807 domain-containing protein [Spirochaetales bacterium]|nr:DUF2807 domain-containing protein [Spirochaetales bacterium]